MVSCLFLRWEEVWSFLSQAGEAVAVQSMNTEERIFYLTSTQESLFLQGVHVKQATFHQDPGVQPAYVSQASSAEKVGPF